jgi:hypothetical protein
MGDFLVVVGAIVAFVALLALAISIRRTPMVGRGAMPGAPAPERKASIPVAGTSIHNAAIATGSVTLGAPTTVKKVVVRKITVHGQPLKESITIDDVTYGSVDEIVDPKLRAQVRSVLHDVPEQINDPALREKVEREFADLGIEGRPESSGSASSGSGEPAGT